MTGMTIRDLTIVSVTNGLLRSGEIRFTSAIKGLGLDVRRYTMRVSVPCSIQSDDAAQLL